MIKTDKVLRVRNISGQTVSVVRELYLREDIPCQSNACLNNCGSTFELRQQLARDASHYVVPDCKVAQQYLELFEFPELSGIIFMHTVANSVQHESGRRSYARLKNIVQDKRKESVIFHNEFQKYAYCPRQAGEELAKWQTRSVYEGAAWYYNHLAGQIPIVMVTTDKQVVEAYGSRTAGVYVLTLDEYLDKFWPHLTSAHQLYESLTSSLQLSSARNNKDYRGYLPLDLLESGIKSGIYIKGQLEVNKHKAQHEAFVHRTEFGSKDTDGQSDILVHGMSTRNRAVHGDTVVVQLLPRSEWRNRSGALTEQESSDANETQVRGHVMPTGRVIGVLERRWRDYVASFAQEENSHGTGNKSEKVLVIPWDYRIPKIRISTSQADALRNHRIVVRLDSWPVDSQYPNGHFVRSLGEIGDLETEVAAILVENSISVGTFSEGQMKEMPVNTPECPWRMDQSEIDKRRDLRTSHLIFSIDPKGCEDVDDTLSVRKLENGGFELGVHIADVSYFVKPKSLSDLEALSRSTTVYLSDRRYDMLPGILSADLCSLVSGVDRYAMSVIWQLNERYEVRDVWYGRTVIHSAYKLFYEIAQAVHDGIEDDELVKNVPELQNITDNEELQTRISELKTSILLLMDVARNLKANRTSGGALQLEGVEVQIQLDDTKKIEDLVPKQPLEVHETIAECMIFANHWVAKKISETFPNQALLRHHPLPREEHFENLIRCAKAKNFTVQTQSNKALADSLDRCVDQDDPTVNKLLRSMATQAMSVAQYFSTGSLPSDDFFHYGLALDRYTHFTSPIRRYADIIVHRLLLASIGQDDPDLMIANKELARMAQHINNKHRGSQNAQKDSQRLFQALFFVDKDADVDECCTVDAVIFQLRENGFLVFIPRYGMKGPVYMRDREKQVLYVTDDGMRHWTSGSLTTTETDITVHSTLGSQTYHLFDHITVNISIQRSLAHASNVKLDLLSNKPHKTDVNQAATTGSKTDIVKEVTSIADEKTQKLIGQDLGGKFKELQEEFGQSDVTTSFYGVLLSLREMALCYDV